MQSLRHGANQIRCNGRLIALHIDHNRIIRPSALYGDLSDAVCARWMVFIRHVRIETRIVHDLSNIRMICGDDDLICIR